MKTRFTKQELIDQVLDREPLLKDHDALTQIALGGTVQVGDDEYMNFHDWDCEVRIPRMNARQAVAEKFIGKDNL